MARTKGQFNFSANLEVKKQAPLDARQQLITYAELTQAATWQDDDGNVWLYDGLVVPVEGGQLWVLTNKDNYQQATSWKRVDAGEAEGKGVITLGYIAKYMDSPVGTDVSEVFGDYTLAELFGGEGKGKIVRFTVPNDLDNNDIGYQPVLFAEEHDVLGLGYRVLIKSKGRREFVPDPYFYELFFSEEDGIKKLTKSTRLRLLTDDAWSEVSEKVLLEDFSTFWNLTTDSTPTEVKSAMPDSLYEFFYNGFELTTHPNVWIDIYPNNSAGVGPVSVVNTDVMDIYSPKIISELIGDKLYVITLQTEDTVNYKIISKSIITVGESNLYQIGALYSLTTGEHNSLDAIVGSPAALIAAINAGKMVVTTGTTQTQITPVNVTSTTKTADGNGTVTIDWVSGNMQFIYSLTFADGAWNGLTDNSKELLRKGEAVESVTSGGNAIEIGGTATKPTVELKINNVGAVSLIETSEGLQAAFNTGQTDKVVSPDAKVIGLNPSGQLYDDIGLTYDSNTKKIALTGKNDAAVAEIDATDFIKDGMVDSVELEGNNLVFTFNTDSGKEEVSVDLSKFIDVYSQGNGITISGKAISVNPGNGLVASGRQVAINIKGGDKYLGFDAGTLASKGIDEAIETAITEAFGWHDA